MTPGAWIAWLRGVFTGAREGVEYGKAERKRAALKLSAGVAFLAFLSVVGLLWVRSRR